jgi:hypothetical protein
MKTPKLVKYLLFTFFLFSISAKSQITAELQLGQGMLDTEVSNDTIYSAFLKLSITDSLISDASKIRLVVINAETNIQENIYVISDISNVSNTNSSWKEGNTFFMIIPPYNPANIRKYFVELLGINNQLIKQFEVEL